MVLKGITQNNFFFFFTLYKSLIQITDSQFKSSSSSEQFQQFGRFRHHGIQKFITVFIKAYYSTSSHFNPIHILISYFFNTCQSTSMPVAENSTAAMQKNSDSRGYFIN
jgi:hypothetical protein